MRSLCVPNAERSSKTMMKYNRHSWWILLIPLFGLIVHFASGRQFLPGSGNFWIICLLVGAIAIFWDNYYLFTLESTLHKFSNIHSGKVKLFKEREYSDLICFSARGSFYDRAFYVAAVPISLGKNYAYRMNIRLELDSPIYSSLELKRKRWGKVDLDPLTVADVYNIRFTLPPTAPGLPSLHNSARFRDEFVTLVDQQKLGMKLARLGKKHHDDRNQFNIYTGRKNIWVEKCIPIRSVDDLENLMDFLQKLAEVIEDISQKYLVV